MMSNIHIMKDENLGGVLREYVEVDRKANVGDYVYYIPFGDIQKVTKLYDNAVGLERVLFVYHENYRTLEPTDVVRINNERYRLVDRKAKVGEKVMYYKDGKSDGVVTTCIGYDDCINVEPYLTEGDDEETCGFNDGYYRVLEPLDSAQELITATEGDNKSIIDLLTNIAQRLTSLERKLERLESATEQNARNIETWAEDIERLKHDENIVLNPSTFAKLLAEVKR